MKFTLTAALLVSANLRLGHDFLLQHCPSYTQLSSYGSGTTGPGPTQTALLSPYSPGIFTVNNQPLIFDSSGNLLGTSNPTTAGSVILIYCTGLGPVATPPPTGSAATGASPTLINPIVVIGRVQATVLSSSLVPGTVGEYQLKVQVPPGITPGSAVSLVLDMDGFVSNPVTIAVQ